MSKIAVYIRQSPWGDVTPETLYNEGMGGREGALVNLAQEWAKAGHQVHAFVPMNTDTAYQEFEDGTVTWISNEKTLAIVEAIRFDLFVSWEDVQILHEVRPYVKKTALEMQVAHLSERYDLSPVDHVCVLSEWAKKFFLRQHPEATDRMVVLPNGIDFELVSEPIELEGVPKKEGPEFIYSSSPDRGLHHLLKMWSMLVEKMTINGGPSPILHVCYGVEKFVESSAWSHREDSTRALEIASLLGQPGIVYHGKVSQEVLAGLHQRSDALLYPADTMQPTETGCITIIEALGAGSDVITTACDCIPSEFGHLKMVECMDLPLDYEKYTDVVAHELISPTLPHSSVAQESRAFARSRGWDKIAQQWETAFDLDALDMVDR